MPHPSITAQIHPHKSAIIMANSGERVSYRQLDKRSNQGAQLFRSLGLVKGDHICLMLVNCRQFLEICWAAQRSGIIFTPISTQLKESEAAYILENSGASVFIASAELIDVASGAAAKAVNVRHRLMIGGAGKGFDSWEEAVAARSTEPVADQSNGVAMLYSSGTTGQPKGVFFPPASDAFDAMHFLAEAVGDLFCFDQNSIYLSPAPLYHAAPLHYCMMVSYQGGTLVIMERFDPEHALQLIEEHRVTHSQWVPIMFIRMLKLPQKLRRAYDLSSMRFAIHAAAPCPVATKEKMIEWWGPVIVEYYGASENIGNTIIDSAQWMSHKGSVGRPVVGHLHIVGDDGLEMTPGEIGTVYFSGEHVNFKYHKEPGKTAGAYNEKGWATVGDVGYVDADGYLYLADRRDFMIISGGVNIYPQEIENLLITHDKVADVAVIGIPHEEFGQEVKAVVQPLAWADASDELGAELIAWLRERLSPVKVPRSVDFRQRLPRRDNGKMYKRQLVEEYREKGDG